MQGINFYIVDVFATNKYEGNQLAVFVDLDDLLSDEQMQRMALEITLLKRHLSKPSRMTFVLSFAYLPPSTRFLLQAIHRWEQATSSPNLFLPEAPSTLTLELAHSDIQISILEPGQFRR